MPPKKSKKEIVRETTHSNSKEIKYCPRCYLDEEKAFLSPQSSFESHIRKCNALPPAKMKNLEKIVKESSKISSFHSLFL